MKTQIIILLSLLYLPIISFANQTDLIEMTRASVLNDLKDPQSAQFKKIEIVTNSLSENAVCGEVNAKNSYGGYTRFKAFFSTNGINVKFLENPSEPSEYRKNLVAYAQAGCLGKQEEFNTRQTEKFKEICEANYDLIREVVVQKKKPEVAYSEVLKNNDLYYSGLVPSKEVMFTTLEEFQSNKQLVKELRSSISYYPKYSENCINNLKKSAL